MEIIAITLLKEAWHFIAKDTIVLSRIDSGSLGTEPETAANLAVIAPQIITFGALQIVGKVTVV